MRNDFQPFFVSRVSQRNGQIVVLAAILFLAISLTVTFGVTTSVLNGAASSRALQNGNQSFYAAEGVSQDVTYRLTKGLSVNGVETLDYGGWSATATTTAVFGGKEIVAAGSQNSFVRKSRVHLVSGDGASFSYGVQTGAGGIHMENSARIAGNVYSNGPVTGANSSMAQGTVVSAGPAGLIDNIHATSSAYAHTIRNSDIEGDAYYVSISNTTVDGTLHPGSPDQATSSLPISDAQIAEWEADAEAGGVYTAPCPYSITGTVTLGPKKINCNLDISDSAVVTLAGPLWVVGDITVSNSPDIKISPSLGPSSIAVIADKASSPTSSGKITLSNSTEYFGSGQQNSFILMISQNKSAEQGGETGAITISNSARGKLLLYAAHGLVTLANSISLKEVTAYRIIISNSARVTYETGLSNLLFTAGPSGGYTRERWREVE